MKDFLNLIFQESLSEEKHQNFLILCLMRYNLFYCLFAHSFMHACIQLNIYHMLAVCQEL